jgi:hypothetical protein
MKKIISILALFFTLFTFAQIPQGISYQAIALDGSGNPIASVLIGIRLSLLDSSSSGTVLYTETHTPTTNSQGLYNLVIGQGTPTTGTFSAIKWESNSKFLKVEMDATGGSNYSLVGSTQLLSVPYAFYAGKVKSENVIGGPDISPISGYGYSTSFMTSTNAYVLSPSAYSSTTLYPNIWHSTPISGTPFMKSVNSFLTSTNAYIFGPSDVSQNNPYIWHSFPTSGQPKKIISFFNNAVIATSTNAYAYSLTLGSGVNTYEWNPTTISGTFIDAVIGNLYIGVLTTTNAYVFGPNANGSANEWNSIPISGTPIKINYSLTQGITILTTTNAYSYCGDPYNFNGGANFSWHNTPITGTLMLD